MSQMRLGFIGAGNWATANHMPVLSAREDVEMAAVCRLGRAELNLVQKRFGFSFATEDYQELLSRSLDGVVISTPHGLHYEHARAALGCGLHVMVEKPMGLLAAEAWELVSTAEQKNLHIVVPYGWHYSSLVERARDHLLNGAIGQIEHMVCHMGSALRELFAEQAWVHEDEALFKPEFRTWSDPVLSGGGYGYGQLTHSLALALWLTGLRGSEVFAYMSGPGARVDIYNAVSIKFEDGAIGSFSGAGTQPAHVPEHQFDLRIFGSEGMLLLDLERERLDCIRTDQKDIIESSSPGDGVYRGEGPPNCFVDLMLGHRRDNPSSGEVAARATEILDAAYRSTVSGSAESVK